MIEPHFIHLRVHSPYSLLKGALRLPKLIDLCKQHRMPAVAVTDHDNLFGSLEFSEYAAKAGIQPIIGMSVSIKPQDADNGNKRTTPDELLLYAKDEAGYQNLLKLSSLSYIAPEDGMAPLLSYDCIHAHSEGLIALSGGPFGGIGRALLANRSQEAERLTLMLKNMFADRFYIELMRHGMEPEQRIEQGLLQLANAHHLPIVATNNVYFASADLFEAHDALMCVSEGRYVTEDNRPKLNPDHRFKSQKEMQLLFADLPEALENSVQIAKRCAVFSPSRAPILPSFHMEDESGQILNESEALDKQAKEGLEERLSVHMFTAEMNETEREAVAKPYRDRLAFELDVIITMKFPGYFLIVSDFIIWAKKHKIPVGPGRGSGAGSLVAWSLQITDLDPLRFGLIFERFLNPERVSMPDFDVDFCQERRDEVIRYVQEKYGSDKVAQIITFGKLQARAVLRDVGRVLQMPYGQVDKISKLVPNNPANPVTLQQAIDMEPELKKLMFAEESVDHLVKLALQLEGLYRHASTHAAGVVIADRALDELVPLYRDPKSDMPVVQYSMKYAENAGLVKFDFLGLKTLSVLQKTIDLLARRNIHIQLETLPDGDPKTYELLSRGDTVGVFQFESAGMQDSLRKLRPDCLEDLIALGALYRPGPMDNIPTYINRKHGKEEPDYLHPMLEEVLKETYGVIIYQEQVQKIAQVMAGYTLGAADLLRRAMGKKIKSEMDAQREQFVSGARANGVDGKQASYIFDLVAKFAGYGFNKSHAAAYAVIAYQTAYLKANYPVEFLAASMTYDMHVTDKLNVFKQEAQKFGIMVLPPDINASEVQFSVDQHGDKLAIRYALAAIKNVGDSAMQVIINERLANGAFADIFDMARRVDAAAMNRRQLEHLIMAGCFDSINPNRAQLFHSSDIILGINNSATRDRISNQTSLFGEIEASTPAQHHLKPQDEWPALEKLQQEFAAIGFYLSSHPLEGYAGMLEQSGVISTARLADRLGREYTSIQIAGIITGKKVKMSQKGKFAFVQLSDAAGLAEISVFDEKLLNNAGDLLENGSMVVIRADAKMEEGGPRIIAQDIKPLSALQPSRRDSKVVIHLSSIDEITKLQTHLGAADAQALNILLWVRIPGMRVQLKLPHRYAIDPQRLSDIQALTSVEEIEWA